MAEGEIEGEETTESRRTKTPIKRLTKEARGIANDPPIGCSAKPITEDYMNWEASILGPEDTPYEDGIFYLNMQFSKEYPLIPPMVKFSTQIYHPNISEDGIINISILKDGWSPGLRIYLILEHVRSLLSNPGFSNVGGNSFLRPDVGCLYLDDKIKYNQIAKEWTLKYAINN